MVKTDYLIPLTAQCSLSQPMVGVLAQRAEIAAQSDIVLGFTPGFPPSDVPMVGPAIFAYGESQSAVESAVEKFSNRVKLAESDFARDEILSLKAAREIMRDHILADESKPLILADSQDNPGAGGSSDTIGILQLAIEVASSLPAAERKPIALALFYAPEVAATCTTIGLGGYFQGAVNGLAIRAKIAALHQGDFIATGPMWGDSLMNLGKMARLEILAEDGTELRMSLLISSHRQQPSSQAIFRILGIEPKNMTIIVLKSSVHFRADFEAIALMIKVVAAPGVNLANPADFPYRRIRANLRLSPLLQP